MKPKGKRILPVRIPDQEPGRSSTRLLDEKLLAGKIDLKDIPRLIPSAFSFLPFSQASNCFV